ncbi:MAG TPA: response regulator [Verrucomicrobiae bacterium]|jgi:PAS domain S-box-containing protein|nr:response regulator [Verrucomicrobiae bacterium]
MSLPADYFQKLVESCPDIIIAVNRSGTIIFYNDGARRTLGFSQEEMLGKDVLEIYPTREDAKKVMSAIRQGEAGTPGKVCNFETAFKTKKGEKIPVAVSASILYDAAGAELGSIGYAKDLRAIRRRDQLATLAEIAIGLSHEINNSLEVLVNQIDLLQQYVGRVASDEEYVIESERLESVEQQLKKIQAITRRIGEMAEEGEYGTREYHGGHMMADLKEKGPPKPEENPQVGHAALEGLRLLVVDDDMGVCCSLKDLLEKELCRVETASSGRHAIDLLERKEFDLVLSDVVMPDMDGYAVYHAVKKKWPALPMILMTAFYYDRDHVIKRSCLEGLQCVIFKKPIDPDRLKNMILKQCRKDEAVLEHD